MIKAVLFDLDGTLLDSAPDLVGALNSLRNQQGLSPLAAREMEKFASAGALGLLQAGMPDADDETVERWRLAFLKHYQENSFAKSRLYDGVSELLHYLKQHAISWGIVTNKPEYLTHPILAAAGLAKSVGTVVCGDTIEKSKPHPAPIHLACHQLRVGASDTLLVGDDPRDLEAGRAAGAMTCAALYGYGSAEFLKVENRDLFDSGISINSPTDLLVWLRSERKKYAPS